MPFPVYSVLIDRRVLDVATTSPQLRPPSGYVWVLKDIETRATGGTGIELRVSIGGILVIAPQHPTGVIQAQWSGMAVVNPNEVLTFHAAGAAFYYQASGYALTIASPIVLAEGVPQPAPPYMPPNPNDLFDRPRPSQ